MSAVPPCSRDNVYDVAGDEAVSLAEISRDGVRNLVFFNNLFIDLTSLSFIYQFMCIFNGIFTTGPYHAYVSQSHVYLHTHIAYIVIS
jgi:hypothetical protein